MVRDGAPVLEWCMSNVVGRYDARAHVYPRRPGPSRKSTPPSR
jgi:phage terminase large subunit-like protein